MGLREIGKLGCLVALAAGLSIGCAGLSGGGVKKAKVETSRSLELTNGLDVPICELFVLYDASDSDEGGWGENRLESGKQLAPGEKMTLNVDKERNDHIDVMANDCDGKMLVRRHDIVYIEPGTNSWKIENPEEREPAPYPTSTETTETAENAETEIYLNIQNECDDKFAYCAIEPSGSRDVSTFSGHATQQFQWEIGTKITARDGENCGEVLHEVTAADKDQTVIICR